MCTKPVTIWYGLPSTGSGFCEEIRERVRELVHEIALDHGFEIMELEVAKDHVHVFISFPPKYSITKVVGILKTVSAREIRKDFPEVKYELWSGEFWEDGYFARSVGDQITTYVIRQYIRFHEDRAKRPEQPRLI